MSPRDPDRPVAVFDSGVGGLTVLHELLVRLPQEDYLYLGDTARFPYGDKTPAQLRAFALQIADELLARDAKLLVVACNSATAAALPALREHVAPLAPHVDVLGVVGNESRLAVAASATGRIGLLATVATVGSGAYPRAVADIDPAAHLTSVACPDLASHIQDDAIVTEEMLATVRGYCAPLREAGVDTVILGCTHYPLVAPMLQRTLGPGVRLVSSGEAMAASVADALAARGIGRPAGGPEGTYRFLATGDPETFRVQGARFLQLPIGTVEHIDVPLEVPA
ncbi:MAG: glutamate racemase [Solirubrobacteraceae bacterium]